MLAVSCFARSNYVDHAVSDQSSITRFAEGNWRLPPISGSFANLSYNQQGTTPAVGPLGNLFDFTSRADDAKCAPYDLDVHTGARLRARS
jgi:phospholipase C